MKRRLPRGAVLTLEQTWALARAWYADRMHPDWRRRTPQDATDAFASVGLTGEFWTMTP
ncbi:MAG TPA: hypothetical protein VFK57_19810 [Vicinamibacterales bacterium]|nr:hypothetical protein [Vicinamibacterales bacterium]